MLRIVSNSFLCIRDIDASQKVCVCVCVCDSFHMNWYFCTVKRRTPTKNEDLLEVSGPSSEKNVPINISLVLVVLGLFRTQSKVEMGVFANTVNG